jgi:acetyltransferase-like isoleucine patch superfamily enzyme
MKKAVEFLASSPLTQVVVTLLIYVLYGVVMGIALVPSVYLLWRAWGVFMTHPSIIGVLAFSVCCGLAVFLYFIAGTLVMGCAVRALSLGIQPGRYPFVSLTMVRWLIYSGIYNLAGTTIFTFVPMSFLTNIFFMILGAKLGKNVQINTWFLNDAYLLELGDNVVIGGKTDVSCHTVEPGKLILQRVKIGSDTLVGQHCYISPGVTIGRRCVIGQYAFIRKNAEIPDRTIISAIAGMPIRQVAKIEKAGEKEPAAQTEKQESEQ